MNHASRIVTVTLNPAIDQTVSIPGFEAGAVNRVQESQSDAGGKGVNVASFLADYGYQMTVTGFLGQENPVLFERLFAQKGIEDRFVRIEGSTRTGIKIIDEVNRETTDINFPGQAPTAEDVERLFDIVEELTAECQWFVLAGSIPAGVSSDIYQELIGIIKERGGFVALDTSGEGLSRALSRGPTLVKPNIRELEEIVEEQLDTREAVIRAGWKLLDEGVQTVIVSMGREGAVFVEGSEVILAVPPQVTVKSTVGAGDAMVSGTVAGKIQGDSLADCARLATAFSIGAITRVGTQLPSQAAIQELMEQVIIRSLR